ncbi:MAG: hypothetical protein KDK78_11165 [Chlamydiia bacterium]|nr:hypothetical protein [Chlamydiia bacterium]
MAAKKQLLNEMELAAAELVVVAKDLYNCSKGALAEEELNTLQSRQEELIQKLVALDASLTEAGGVSEDEEAWGRVRDALDEFQNYNQQFISNVNVRKGLVQFDLANVRKSRRFLSEMKSTYGKAKPKAKKAGKVDKLQ